MSNRTILRELRRNTLLISISYIGSRAIAFILAPLYSFYLTTSQYGTMDLITTTAELLIPFFCMDIFEATFRFSNDESYDNSKILSSSLAVCFPGLLISIIILIISILKFENYQYIVYAALYIISGSFISVFSQYVRGQKQMKVFAAVGVINSLVLLLANLFLIVGLRLELRGWLISYLIAQFCTVIYLIIKCEAHRLVRIKSIDKEYIQTFMRFCMPLIPTASMWWVMNVSDRYMIALYLDTAFNGVYSVANKLPAMLSVFERIFYQAWQTTAISTMEDKNRDSFYSTVFWEYFRFLVVGVIGLLTIGRPIIIYFFAKDYRKAWICLPPLILGVLIHALAGNLGSLYSVFKNTKGALYSAIAGALTNIILNFIFISKFGILGAASTTLIGYIITLTYRWIDVKKFVQLSIKTKDVIISIILIIVQLCLYYINTPFSYICRVFLLITAVIINRDVFQKILSR